MLNEPELFNKRRKMLFQVCVFYFKLIHAGDESREFINCCLNMRLGEDGATTIHSVAMDAKTVSFIHRSKSLLKA